MTSKRICTQKGYVPDYPQSMTDSVRADVWVWSIRLYSTRSKASAACKAGHVRINDDKAKPSSPVRLGDKVTVTGGDWPRILEVAALLTKRVGAPLAVLAYIDHTPPRPRKEVTAAFAVRDRGTGRPTKKDRRALDRLRGRDGER